jgi:hypothetical protein
MAFIGRFQLGGTVPLFLITTDANKTPQVPTFPPTVKIWKPSGLLQVAFVPTIETYTQTGVFLGRVFLGAQFAVGLYRVSYYYQIGLFQGVQVDNFEIMAGGNADGNVMSMYYYACAQANFVVQGLDSGKIVQGRNPTF